MWNNDAHGLLFKCSEVKLYSPSHTYGMKLSQLPRQKGTVRIITYKFAALPYAIEQLARRPHDIKIIVNSKFSPDARRIKKELPGVEIRVHPELHDKVVLIEPSTIYMGSANFGHGGWSESTVGLRSKEAFDWFLKTRWEPLWAESRLVV